MAMGTLPMVAEGAPVYHPQPQPSQPACAADIPLHDPGITSDALKLPFNLLLRDSFKQTDLLFIGDVGHEDLRVAGYLATAEIMTELQKSDVKHIFVEMPNNTQRWADQLAARKTSKAGFINDMLSAGYRTFSEETTMGILSMMADTITNAANAGMKVYFIDFDKGFTEQVAAERADNTLRRMMDSGMYSEAQIAAARAKALEADRKFNLVRLDDRDTAKYINTAVKPGEKALLFYGAMHGTRFNDFEEFFTMPSLRLDLHADNASYHIQMSVYQRDAQAIPLRKGEDKPDMVYVLEEQELYLTCATPAPFSKLFMQPPATPQNLQM